MEKAQGLLYLPFAMHFYSLIYAGVMKKKDPERAAVCIQRGEMFRSGFLCGGLHGLEMDS